VEWAVHGFDLVLLVLHLHGLEHVLFVEVEVARCLPEAKIRHVRGVQQLVSVLKKRGDGKIRQDKTGRVRDLNTILDLSHPDRITMTTISAAMK
jgi:hypothetical protein